MILIDNLVFSLGFTRAVQTAIKNISGADMFGYQVSVVSLDANMNAVSLVEKPDFPGSNYAVTGLYF